MALIVKLFINETQIAQYEAVRKQGIPGELCDYQIAKDGNNGVWISHHYDDGAEALAVKVLLHQLISKNNKIRSTQK